MNKSASLLKLMAWSFAGPAVIYSMVFLYPTNSTVEAALSLSEICLAVFILGIMVYPYKAKNYNIEAAIIVITSIFIAVYTVTADYFVFYYIKESVRILITSALVASLLIFLKVRNIERELMAPLSIWLCGLLAGFIQDQSAGFYLSIKAGAYIYFSYYFYKATYSAYMEKINRSEEMLKTMETSLNKEVKKRVFEIEKSNERLLEISKTDMLTKAFNKVTIMNIIDRLITNKKIEVFSILMFDIDNFKIINDSLGHVTGDVCLKTLANIASGNIREVDYLGRYGGDEFIIVLPTLGETEAKFVAERFKRKVSETSNPRFTVSIGISSYPKDGQTVKDLISVADKGLYKSKSKGKNTISHA
ncbi:MAG: GGDEF domain-containing protein [Pseudomonadota bacterium]